MMCRKGLFKCGGGKQATAVQIVSREIYLHCKVADEENRSLELPQGKETVLNWLQDRKKNKWDTNADKYFKRVQINFKLPRKSDDAFWKNVSADMLKNGYIPEKRETIESLINTFGNHFSSLLVKEEVSRFYEDINVLINKIMM